MAFRSGYKKNNKPTSNDEYNKLLECFTADYSEMVRLAQQLGAEKFNDVLEALGGTKPHIPTKKVFWHRLQRECRDESIRAKFTGDNYNQLAEEYDLSRTQVYRIIEWRPR